MELKFFPFDFEYKIKNGKTFLYIYAKEENVKEENGRKICVVQEYHPYFYALVENIDVQTFEKRLHSLIRAPKKELKESALNSGDTPHFLEPQVISWQETEKELLGKKKKIWKVTVNYPKAVPIIAKELESWGLDCYERDILFIHRYLRDKRITPMTLVKAEGKFIDHEEWKIPLFLAEEVTPLSLETSLNWKILAIDIETYAQKKEIDPEKNPILMIALYGIDETGKELSKVITWREFAHDLDYLEIVQDEAALINRFKRIVEEFQPEILTGYFSDGFDLPYLKTRASKHRINLNIGLDGSGLIVNSQTGFRESVCKISGIVHLDILKFIKNIFGKNLQIDSYSLNAVSGELLGKRKNDVNLDELATIWDNQPENLPQFCAYNLQDSCLAFQLCQHLLFDMVEFSKIIGLPMFDVTRMSFSKLVENYILTRAVEFNIIAPNKPENFEIEQRRLENIQGGFVYEPTPGIYENIVVFDFRSLYPTIITSHNLGPEGFNCDCCPGKAAVPEMERHWFCIKSKKFLPTVLEALITRRDQVKKEIKEVKAKGEETKTLEARSYALKILANSFYGYLGFFGARWYSLESAAATTAYARNYIKNTIALARNKTFKVIYADTDSCFLLLGDKTKQEARNFMNEINQNLPGNMELEFEGHFQRGIFVSLKGNNRGNRGAKKKYALLAEDGKIKITGFETVRRNWSPLAKEVQKEVLQLVLTNKINEALQYLRKVINDLQCGAIYLDKLTLKSQITKELSSYTALAPHVKVARELAAKGEKIVPGTVISYIVVKGRGLIRDRAKIPEEVNQGEHDTNYYLNHQVVPAVSSIFAVLGYSEDQLFNDSSQTGLDKFM